MKKHSTSFVFLMGLLFLSASAVFLMPSVNHTENPIEQLRTSAGEITIVTPENKTFTEPDSGYYPATYGFENDLNGYIPEEWEYRLTIPQQDSYIQVIPSLDGHNKVVDMNKGNTYGSHLHMWNNFSDQEYGAIEFWIRTTSLTEGTGIHPQNGDTAFCGVGINGQGYESSFAIYTIGGWQTVALSTSINTWYHVSLQFECGTGNHYDLDQFYFKVIINDVEFGDFRFFENETLANNIRILQNWRYENYHTYLDAIGYSWDPSYNVGDNLNEGLLLSYENTTNLDWKGYSLDNQANKTIMGNATIPIPADGFHNVQVFGNSSIGTIYESNLRYFSVNSTPYISIATPENKTYTEPDSGYYPATYGFDNDEDGSFPEGWVDSSGSGCTVEVQSSFDSYKKVIKFEDTSTTYNSVTDLYFVNQTQGSIEFWFQKITGTTWCYMQLRESTTSTLVVDVGVDGPDNGYFSLNAGGEGWLYNSTYSDNLWYHIKFEFNCITDKITYWINGIPMFYDKNFTFSTDTINWFRFGTNSHRTGIFYIDALGYSWDPNYNIGDNLNEGLLLSYDNTTNLDWKGYSLDGQANRTILGSTTIPMPADGLHSIQVFGNDSIGAMYESDVRYFTTNGLGPDITINSPISNQLYGTIPPDFSLSIADSDLDARWYSLDGGTTNVAFSGLTGTIDQSEWDKIGNGTANITFYANDTANNIGQAEVIVWKDIIPPVISIITPNTGVEFDYTPIFEISIVEVNLDEYWYTIDDGGYNYTITELSGTISQSAWNGLPNGPVTIRFYARDKAGNIGTSFIIVAKIPSEQPTPPPGIPGYDLYLLIGALSVISTLLIRKRLKS